MFYTNQRRRELNKALFFKLQNPLLATATEDGVHLFLERLPEEAEEMTSEIALRQNVPHCALPWNQVMPVFMPVNNRGKKGYLAGYVNDSEESICAASEKISSCGLYYIPGLTLVKGVDYGRI